MRTRTRTKVRLQSERTPIQKLRQNVPRPAMTNITLVSMTMNVREKLKNFGGCAK